MIAVLSVTNVWGIRKSAHGREKAAQTIKNKVFTALFNSREHIAEIYNEFQPEENPIKAGEISFITLGKHLDAEHYDAGFLANDSHVTPFGLPSSSWNCGTIIWRRII